MDPKNAASEMVKTLNLTQDSPISLQKVLDHLGYKAELFPNNEKTQMLACGVNQDNRVVMANSGDAPAEQRYAFAHAMAHVVLHPGKNRVDRKSNLHHTIEEPEEWDANRFADELLMYSDLFLFKWDEHNGDLGRLAKVFGLSKERIAARAEFLGIV